MSWEPRGAVGILRLDRPEVHNVVDEVVIARLEEILDHAERNSAIRVVIVTGTGSQSFCAGSDLNAFEDSARGNGEKGPDPFDLDAGYEVILRMRQWLERLAGGGKVVIAALNGDVFGGGCEIAAACHLRLSAEHVRLTFRQASMGLITGWGGGARLFRLLGRSTALRLLLTGDPVEAEEALALGLVDRVVPAADLMDEALAWAEKIAAQPAASVRAFLDLARAADDAGRESVRAVESRLFEERWNGDDFRRRLEDWHRRRRRRKTAGAAGAVTDRGSTTRAPRR